MTLEMFRDAMACYLKEAVMKTAVSYFLYQLCFRVIILAVECFFVSSSLGVVECCDSREKSRIGGADIVTN